MTREEILQAFDDINFVYNDCTKYDTLKRMLEELTERQRGEWVDKWHTLWKEELPACSVCNNISVFKSNYCPNCGSYMRGEDDE